MQKHFSYDRSIHIIPKAVSCKAGTATFYTNEYDATNSFFPRPVSSRRYYPKSAGPKKEITVDAIDLDGFIRANNMSGVDILKMDIQGGELNALHGAKCLLETQSISIIFTEIMFVPHYESAPYFHQIWSFLSKYGFSLFDVYNLQRAANGQLRYGDALFVNQFVRNTVIDKYPEEP